MTITCVLRRRPQADVFRLRSVQEKCLLGFSVAVSETCRSDVARIGAIFADCLEASGGPFLMGAFSAMDAFYAPVLTRIQTYMLLNSEAVKSFATALDTLPAWQEWRSAALAETVIIATDEVE